MKNTLLLLLFVCVFVSNACELCIINSACEADYIHFNISISNECEHPMKAYFSYVTDIESERRYLNKTIRCHDCHFDLMIEPIHDAWDYILTFESPKPAKSCSIYKAHCGGDTSRYIWIGTAGLSGLFIVFGFLLCIIRSCRTSTPIQKKSIRKKAEISVINS